MTRRIWVRLSLAFAGIIVAAVVAVLLVVATFNSPDRVRSLVDRAVRSPGGLVERLENLYERRGSWFGVSRVLGRQQTFIADRLPPSADFVLTDVDGTILYDGTTDGVTPETLSRLPPRQAAPIRVDGVLRGYLWTFVDFERNQNTFQALFVRQLTQASLIVAAAGSVVGIGLGVIVSRSLTAPLRHLAEAALAIRDGQLGRRVPAQGSVEIEQVAAAFNEMAAGLQQAERLRQNLLADVAHELRTPLSVLQGNLYAVLDGVYPFDREQAARLYDQTRLLSRLVNDLHDLARAEANQLPLQMIPQDPGLFVTDVVSVFAPVAEGREVRLIQQIAPDLPLAAIDPDRMQQVLNNLLNNALRHTPAGGHITVSVEAEANEADESHEARGTRPGGVRITVRDTGQGIAPEHLPYLFDRFYRADSSRARRSGGAGLGLAIVRAIVEAHGGSVRAESPGSGQGSAFVITLPAVTLPADVDQPV